MQGHAPRAWKPLSHLYDKRTSAGNDGGGKKHWCHKDIITETSSMGCVKTARTAGAVLAR
jgi:hypothetical protein